MYMQDIKGENAIKVSFIAIKHEQERLGSLDMNVGQQVCEPVQLALPFS
jgi:hypothetical protein